MIEMTEHERIVEALSQLRPNAQFRLQGTKLMWTDPTQIEPTQEEIDAKIQELRVAEPMRLLRQERNRRIAQTDWRFRSDLSPSQEWIDYSQALRDLPANYSPTIDILTEDEYPLVKEDNTTPWPEEPNDG